MDSGLKVCEKVNIGPSTFSVLHFLSLYIFSILFRYKILFFLFSFHVLERRKRELLDFDRIKKKYHDWHYLRPWKISSMVLTSFIWSKEFDDDYFESQCYLKEQI